VTQYYTLKDRFWYDMSELYSVQKNALNLLPAIANESGDRQLQNLVQQATQDMQQHMRDLEQCFKAENIHPTAVTGDTVMGLRQEHALLDATSATHAQILAYDFHALARIFSYQVAAYRAVTDIARLLGDTQCEQTLQKDLQHVEDFSRQLEQMRSQIGERAGVGA